MQFLPAHFPTNSAWPDNATPDCRGNSSTFSVIIPGGRRRDDDVAIVVVLPGRLSSLFVDVGTTVPLIRDSQKWKARRWRDKNWWKRGRKQHNARFYVCVAVYVRGIAMIFENNDRSVTTIRGQRKDNNFRDRYLYLALLLLLLLLLFRDQLFVGYQLSSFNFISIYSSWHKS